MKTVHVAAGIIRNPQDNSVLAVQRGYGDMQGLWEFPGGKVQRGETAYDACIRELQEELCVEVHNLRAFYTVEYDYEAFHLSMECFFCDIAHGKVSAADQQKAIRWIPQRSLADLTWMPADVELVRALIAAAEALDSAKEPLEAATEPPRRQATLIRQKTYQEKPDRHFGYTWAFCKRNRTRASPRRHQKIHAGQQTRKHQTRDARTPAPAPGGPHRISPAVEQSARQAGHRVSRAQDRHLR